MGLCQGGAPVLNDINQRNRSSKVDATRRRT